MPCPIVFRSTIPRRGREEVRERHDAGYSRAVAESRMVAAEHVVWAAAHGFAPEDLAAALGAPPLSPDWQDIVALLAARWRRLRPNMRFP